MNTSIDSAPALPFNVRELPFFVEGQWKPDRTNHYARDCEKGRAAGARIIEAIRQSENPALLPAVVRAIVSGGEFGAIETGLFSELGIALT